MKYSLLSYFLVTFPISWARAHVFSPLPLDPSDSVTETLQISPPHSLYLGVYGKFLRNVANTIRYHAIQTSEDKFRIKDGLCRILKIS